MRKMKKIIIVCVSVVVALALIIGGIFLFKEKERTGEEWLLAQDKYLTELEDFSKSMDDIVTLYLIGSISPESFQNHLYILEQELMIMKAVYDKDISDKPVKIGTHTYSTKKGTEAIYDCYLVLADILFMARTNIGDINALSYKYIAYQQEIADNLAEYLTALQFYETEEQYE